MEPVISEIKYLGGATLDFIEVRIPDDYPDPENLVLVIYDRFDDGSTTATPSAADMYVIESEGDTSDDTTADGLTHYILAKKICGDVMPKAKTSKPPTSPRQAMIRPAIIMVVDSKPLPKRPAMNPPKMNPTVIVPM